MIDGIADALKLGSKITGILDRLTTDTNIKEEFQSTGKIDGTFTLGNYQILFTVYDRNKIIDTEVQNVE